MKQSHEIFVSTFQLLLLTACYLKAIEGLSCYQCSYQLENSPANQEKFRNMDEVSCRNGSIPDSRLLLPCILPKKKDMKNICVYYLVRYNPPTRQGHTEAFARGCSTAHKNFIPKCVPNNKKRQEQTKCMCASHGCLPEMVTEKTKVNETSVVAIGQDNSLVSNPIPTELEEEGAVVLKVAKGILKDHKVEAITVGKLELAEQNEENGIGSNTNSSEHPFISVRDPTLTEEEIVLTETQHMYNSTSNRNSNTKENGQEINVATTNSPPRQELVLIREVSHSISHFTITDTEKGSNCHICKYSSGDTQESCDTNDAPDSEFPLPCTTVKESTGIYCQGVREKRFSNCKGMSRNFTLVCKPLPDTLNEKSGDNVHGNGKSLSISCVCTTDDCTLEGIEEKEPEITSVVEIPSKPTALSKNNATKHFYNSVGKPNQMELFVVMITFIMLAFKYVM